MWLGPVCFHAFFWGKGGGQISSLLFQTSFFLVSMSFWGLFLQWGNLNFESHAHFFTRLNFWGCLPFLRSFLIFGSSSYLMSSLFLRSSPCLHICGCQCDNYFCQTPVLGLGLGVDFTFAWDNKNNNNDNPHLNFVKGTNSTINKDSGGSTA